LLYGAISILARLVLQDTIAAVVAINVSENNSPSTLATEILEILPARVPRNPRYGYTKARRSSSPHVTVSIVGVPLWSALLGELDDNVGSHKALSIEGIQSILGITSAFKLDKTKSSHHTNVDNTSATVEKSGNVVRASVDRQATKIQSAGHGGDVEVGR